VEIAKALIQESKVIILDEPTASFSQTEIEHLLSIVRKLAQGGLSIIYISTTSRSLQDRRSGHL